MPLATREPRNGGVKIGDVGGDVGARRHVDGDRALGFASATCAAAGSRPPGVATELGVELAGLLALHERVHRVEALERVLAVEEAAVVDLAQVALDVVAGERGAAEQHRDLGEARGRSAPGGSRA